MNIYILRHGEAEPASASLRDAQRPLTPRGKHTLETVLKAARRMKVTPDAIFTSPLVRARQTAEIAGSILKCKHVVQTKHLNPAARPDLMWKELCSLKNVNHVVLAGHEPHLSQLIGFLLVAPMMVDLKKSAMVRIETKPNHGPPRGVLKWMLTPRLAEALR